jgi:hypothetical protein
MFGSLMYATTATRPDIAYPIRVLTRYNHGQSNEYMVALKRVFRSLNGMKDWRVHFGGGLGVALGGEGDGALGC